jgi:hypothetical protein
VMQGFLSIGGTTFPCSTLYVNLLQTINTLHLNTIPTNWFLSSFSADVNEFSTLLLDVAMKRKHLPAACSKMLSNTLKIEINNLVGYIYHMYQ